MTALKKYMQDNSRNRSNAVEAILEAVLIKKKKK